MKTEFQQIKDQILGQLDQMASVMTEMGVGAKFDTEGAELYHENLHSFSFIPEGTRVYHKEGKYYLVDAEGILIYYGSIDAATGYNTAIQDLVEFPHLTEIAILTGKQAFTKIDRLLSEPSYLMSYSAEMMAGLVKSHANGHIDLNTI